MEDVLIPWKNVVYCQKDAHIKAIAALFLHQKVGCIVVCNKKQPVGIITKTDMLVPILKPTICFAYQIMNSNLIFVEKSDEIASVCSVMLERHIHHVLVREEGRVVGLVSSTDILTYIVKQDESENQAFYVQLAEGKRKMGSQWDAILQDEDYDIWLSKI